MIYKRKRNLLRCPQPQRARGERRLGSRIMIRYIWEISAFHESSFGLNAAYIHVVYRIAHSIKVGDAHGEQPKGEAAVENL